MQLLTPSQIDVFGYHEDLKYYYLSGHGSAINKIIACFTVQDLLERFESNESPEVTAYYSHSAVIQQFLTALDAFKDKTALNANNYLEMAQRKWKTSYISPFAANIGVVKYECPTESKVKIFVNEETLKLDWCSADGICNWSDMIKKYSFYKNANCEAVYCPK